MGICSTDIQIQIQIQIDPATTRLVGPKFIVCQSHFIDPDSDPDIDLNFL
jgi:hypothetical protein